MPVQAWPSFQAFLAPGFGGLLFGVYILWHFPLILIRACVDDRLVLGHRQAFSWLIVLSSPLSTCAIGVQFEVKDGVPWITVSPKFPHQRATPLNLSKKKKSTTNLQPFHQPSCSVGLFSCSCFYCPFAESYYVPSIHGCFTCTTSFNPQNPLR